MRAVHSRDGGAEGPTASVSGSPSRSLAITAALAPAAGLFLALASALTALGPGLPRAFEESGSVGFGLLALGVAVCAVAGVVLRLVARGAAIPAIVPLGCALLPWLAGDAGMRHLEGIVAAHARWADAGSVSAFAARGLSEALAARVLGASLASGITAGAALGLALAALALRAPRRAPRTAILGALLGAVTIAATLAGALLVDASAAIAGVMSWMLVAFLAIPVLAIALAAVGRDARGRSGALASAAAVGVGLALFGAGIAAESALIRAPLSVIPSADPESWIAILVASLRTADAAARARTLGAAATSLAALVVVGWSLAQQRLSVRAVAGALALALGAAAMISLDGFAASAASERVASIAVPWWLAHDVRPISLYGYESRARGVDLALRAGDAIAWDGRRSDATPAALEALVREALSRPLPEPPAELYEERPPDELEPPEPTALSAPDAPSIEPTIVVVPDAAAGARAWRALLEGAARAGARSIVVEGVATGGSEGAWPIVRDLRARTFVSAVLPVRTGRLVLLEPALPEGFADRDPTLWHLTIEGDLRAPIEPRGRAGVPGRWSATTSSGTVYAALGAGATTVSIGRALDVLETGRDVVLVPGDVPGHPERDAVIDGAPSDATIELLETAGRVEGTSRSPGAR